MIRVRKSVMQSTNKRASALGGSSPERRLLLYSSRVPSVASPMLNHPNRPVRKSGGQARPTAPNTPPNVGAGIGAGFVIVTKASAKTHHPWQPSGLKQAGQRVFAQ